MPIRRSQPPAEHSLKVVEKGAFFSRVHDGPDGEEFRILLRLQALRRLVVARDRRSKFEVVHGNTKGTSKRSEG